MTNETAAQATAAEDERETNIQELILVMESRVSTYGFLARLYREEVSEEFLQELHDNHYRVSTGNANIDKGHKLFATYLSNLWENSHSELAVDFMRTFFGHGYTGCCAAYPYESVYASEKRLMMQGARDEILALYRAAGVDKKSSWKEGEDHIALELEYIQILCQRTAEAVKEGKGDEAFNLVKMQYNFMEDHLLAWVPLLTDQMRDFTKTKFYEGLSYMTDGFLESDMALLTDLLSIDEQDESAEELAADSEAADEFEGITMMEPSFN